MRQHHYYQQRHREFPAVAYAFPMTFSIPVGTPSW